MSEKFEVTKEAILAMVEKCPEAKEALKAGFPGAFENKKSFDLIQLTNGGYICTNQEAEAAGFNSRSFLAVRIGGEYDGIAFYLEENYLRWNLVRDGNSALCLTVERKD
ncbi:hypothetical protein LCGC14_1069080 [marine sediment metagenome]|uniref:Uncharacterized protein n=1 Tax=marine sediment metagenome TaxID=412755 RepID=A0A0F9MIT5_9ZZZZ|nr:hypothetical protein [Pricia sp.]